MKKNFLTLVMKSTTCWELGVQLLEIVNLGSFNGLSLFGCNNSSFDLPNYKLLGLPLTPSPLIKDNEINFIKSWVDKENPIIVSQILTEQKGISGIYCWKCSINGRMYVGRSEDKSTRFWAHYRGKSSNILLQRSIKKYGMGGFEFGYLEILNPQNKEILIKKEQRYLDDLFRKPKELRYNVSQWAEGGGVEFQDPNKKQSKAESNNPNFGKVSGNAKSVSVFDKDRNLIKHFTSFADLQREQGIDSRTAYKHIRNKTLCLKKYYFESVHFESTQFPGVKTERQISISKHNLDGTLYKKFKTKTEAAIELKILKRTLNRYIKDGIQFEDKYLIKGTAVVERVQLNYTEEQPSGLDVGVITRDLDQFASNAKAVAVFDKEGNQIKHFGSLAEQYEEQGIAKATVKKHIRNQTLCLKRYYFVAI